MKAQDKDSLAEFRAKIKVAGPDSRIYRGGLSMTAVRVDQRCVVKAPATPQPDKE